MHFDSVDRIEQLIGQLMRLALTEPEAWSELDLTMTQFKALLFLRARQPLSISKIGSALGISLASASALVDRLARLGLVTRREDAADRRQTLVELAADGDVMLSRIEMRMAARRRRIVAAMSPSGRAALEAALEDLIRVAAAEAQSRDPADGIPADAAPDVAGSDRRPAPDVEPAARRGASSD